MNLMKKLIAFNRNSQNKRIGFLFIGGFSIILIVTFSTFLVFNFISSKNEMKKDLTTLANLIGINCAAPLLFNDQNAAQDILSALHAKPRIQAAYIVGKDNITFAQYLNPNTFSENITVSGPSERQGFDILNNRFYLRSTIRFKNQVLGSVYLESDLLRLYSHLRWFISASVIIFLLTGTIVYILFDKLLHTIEALNESKDRYHSVFENTGTATIIIDEDGVITMANAMFEKFIGLPKKDIEGKVTWTDLIDPYDLPKIGNIQISAEHELKLKDKYVFLKADLLPGTTKTIISITDITTRKQAEEELRKSEHMKTEFIYVASHELKTPVQSMLLGALDLIENEDVKNNPALYEDMEMVTNGVKRLADLVENLLDLSRIEARTTQLNIETVDVKEMIDNAVNEIFSLASKYHHNIIVDCELNSFTINADQNKLEQVFVNLLGNSIKYTPKGGDIMFSAKKKDADAVFSVADNGYGIPAFAQEDIFKKFFQADSFMSQRVGGTGLGLTISKSIIDDHNGSIECASPVPEGMFPDLKLGEDRKGTVFIVKLPINE